MLGGLEFSPSGLENGLSSAPRARACHPRFGVALPRHHQRHGFHSPALGRGSARCHSSRRPDRGFPPALAPAAKTVKAGARRVIVTTGGHVRLRCDRKFVAIIDLPFDSTAINRFQTNLLRMIDHLAHTNFLVFSPLRGSSAERGPGSGPWIGNHQIIEWQRQRFPLTFDPNSFLGTLHSPQEFELIQSLS